MSTRVIPVPLGISNAFLLLGDRPVLVDAGSPGDDERLIAGLRDHRLTPRDLSLIVLTHGHTDHTGAVAAAAAGGAPVAIGGADAVLLRDGHNGPLTPTGPAGAALGVYMKRQRTTGHTADIRLEGSQRLDRYGVGGELVHVGGHTPCHPLRHYFTEDRAANRAALQLILERDARTVHVGHGGPIASTDLRRRFQDVA
jgi:hydroxyacylglutathione hydrolase